MVSNFMEEAVEMSINDEQLLHVGRRAYELLQSGQHVDFASIWAAIIEEGHVEGVAWFEVPGVMAALEHIVR
jgi:hypothetical protein